VRIRGREEFIVPPLLVFGAQKPPAVPVPAAALRFYAHFAYHDPGTDSSTEPPKPLWAKADLRRGFLPAGVFHQLCVAAVGWCFHTVIGFEPSLGKSHAFVRFGR
jgi:hypothetical protein